MKQLKFIFTLGIIFIGICCNVTKDQIIKAMEQGARTLNDIRKMTGACTLHRCKELSPKGT